MVEPLLLESRVGTHGGEDLHAKQKGKLVGHLTCLGMRTSVRELTVMMLKIRYWA